MDTFKQRFPEKQQLIYVFLATAFASNAWALYNITQELPAWIKRLSLAEMVGVMSHNLYLALLDSLPIFIGLTLLSIILPKAWLRQRFTALGSAMAVLTAVWFMILHANALISTRNSSGLIVWAVSYLVIAGGAYILIQKNEKVYNGVRKFIEQLALLAAIYIVLDILGIIVVIVRNIGGVA